MTTKHEFDAVVVGGSIGGCASAILLAQQGWRVALLERSPDPQHYKKACTHFIQPIALPVMRQLGLTERFAELGAVRGELEVLTRWGWIRADCRAAPRGYNIRRQALDPLLRDLAARTEGVTLMAGASADGLLTDSAGRITGVSAAWEGRCDLSASLVVAADGANSRLAKLANLTPRRFENGRFTFYGYFPRVDLGAANSRYWHLDDRLAYAFHNHNDTSLLGVFLPKSETARFKADPLGEFRRFWRDLPHAPSLEGVEPIGGLLGMMEMPNQRRPACAPGLALVGDAAMQTDPIWGAGCGFAFASAQWLAETVGPARARGTAAIDRALLAYRKKHLAATRGHFWHIRQFSRVRRPDLFERLVFSAAVHDPDLSERILTYLSRTVGLSYFASPSTVARAVMVHACRLGSKFDRLLARVARSIRPAFTLGTRAKAA